MGKIYTREGERDFLTEMLKAEIFSGPWNPRG